MNNYIKETRFPSSFPVTNSSLVKLLGIPTEMEVWHDMSDNDFRDCKDYISASGLKDYLTDPILALGRRVLKTIPPKKYTDATLSNFRVGRAIHFWALEGGKEETESAFPVFEGKRRAGKAWEQFQEENPLAKEKDNILSMAEYETVSALGVKLEKAIEELDRRYRVAGWNLVQRNSEVSLFVKWPGLHFKGRLDGIRFYYNPKENQLAYTILEIKTTRQSVFDGKALAKEIQNFNYHLQCMIYLTAFSEIERQLNRGKLLGLYHQAVWPHQHWSPETRVFGNVRILWASKETQEISCQEVSTLEDTNLFEWQHFGNLAIGKALHNIHSILVNTQTHLQDITKEEDIKIPLMELYAPPPPWMAKQYEEYSGGPTGLFPEGFTKMTPLRETDIRTQLSLKFPSHKMLPTPPIFEPVEEPSSPSPSPLSSKASPYIPPTPAKWWEPSSPPPPPPPTSIAEQKVAPPKSR